MIFKKMKVTNPKGLNARYASMIATICMNSNSRVDMQIGLNSVNPTNVYEIMARPIRWGAELTFSCDGEDEKETLEKLAACVTEANEE